MQQDNYNNNDQRNNLQYNQNQAQPGPPPPPPQYPNGQQDQNNNNNPNISQSFDTEMNNNHNDNPLNQPLAYKEEELQGTNLLGYSRQGFVRKVYLILMAMLSITVLMTFCSMKFTAFSNFQANNLWLYFTSLGVAICIEIAVFCYHSVATKVPTNYILCFSFATCFSYMVSAICGFYQQAGQQQIVLIAAGATFGITLALTIYAMTTKTDFTYMGGLLWCMCMSLIMFGLFYWIFPSQVMNILYCCLGVVVYGLFLVYDTQLICGGKKFELDYDFYILGAMMIFIDIIMIFLYILQLLGSN